MKLKDFFTGLILVSIVLIVTTSFGQAFQGSYVWTKRMGGTSIDATGGVTTDPAGNVYITGSFEDTVNFGADFGITDAKTSAGEGDVFITRINANGTYGWTKRMGGTLDDSSGEITTDPAGNVYIIGSFQGIVNFGADFGVSDTKASAGDYDIFVTKINANGTYGGTKRIGGVLRDRGSGITIYSPGIFITGYFQDKVDFGADFGTSDTKASAGDNDIFVTRINLNGTYGWTRRMGGTSYDIGIAIATDLSNNIYVTGQFEDTVNFSADFGTNDIKTSDGDQDIFVVKISTGATYRGAKRIGGVWHDWVSDITTDSFENVYITGYFEETLDFGADFGTSDTKASAGENDIFITRINTDGTYGWTRRMGGELDDEGYGITTDPSGNIYVTGFFQFIVDFGADFEVTDIKRAAAEGRDDIFVTRLNGGKGTYVGTNRMGGPSFDRGRNITTDLSGKVYVTGWFRETVNFGEDFGVTDTKASEGDRDVFVTKLTVPLRIFDGHDFDGNSTSDAAVWRPSNGRWYIKDVGNYLWGELGDIPVNGDYNGDETTDIAVWRPSNGRWYLMGMTATSWGTLGDIPVPGDYDGDGDTDIAVWRPSNGRWYVKGLGTTSWGTAGDLPVPGDYNGDGITEIAVWRPSNGRWYIHGIGTTSWGTAGDFPVPGDYNGDKITEIAVWRPSNGRWYIQGAGTTSWGTAGDFSVPGDYDGDGDTDLAVWRPTNGRWYIKDIGGYLWGMLGDIPLVR